MISLPTAEIINKFYKYIIVNCVRRFLMYLLNKQFLSIFNQKVKECGLYICFYMLVGT